PSLQTNPQRVEARPRIIPIVKEIFSGMTKAELMAKCERVGLPFAPISKPEDLFEDPHLLASGGLTDVTLPNGTKTRSPALPVEMNDRRFGTRLDLPGVGQHTHELLAELGYPDARIQDLVDRRVVAARNT
ncbi:MAG TPA: CoA transferase, partial [Burkholderiales bacterium]|nr:CoA transferase [Burkholderiales bacterium]